MVTVEGWKEAKGLALEANGRASWRPYVPHKDKRRE